MMNCNKDQIYQKVYIYVQLQMCSSVHGSVKEWSSGLMLNSRNLGSTCFATPRDQFLMIFFTQPRGKPEKPQNVRPVASSYDFITLAWDEGFDGGYDTFYTVQFKKLGENVPRYDDGII